MYQTKPSEDEFNGNTVSAICWIGWEANLPCADWSLSTSMLIWIATSVTLNTWTYLSFWWNMLTKVMEHAHAYSMYLLSLCWWKTLLPRKNQNYQSKQVKKIKIYNPSILLRGGFREVPSSQGLSYPTHFYFHISPNLTICAYKAHTSVLIYMDCKENQNEPQKRVYRYFPLVKLAAKSNQCTLGSSWNCTLVLAQSEHFTESSKSMHHLQLLLPELCQYSDLYFSTDNKLRPIVLL